jgi:MYXO-CTERM domain-containing protein
MQATSPGLDLDSAGIGAAAGAAILAAGAAGLAGVRRRRKTHPHTLSTP